MTGSGLYHYAMGERVTPEMTREELLALEIGLRVGSGRVQLKAPKKGAPKKPEFGSINCFRAFKIWAIVNSNPEKRLHKLSNRALIALVQKVEEINGVPETERTFKSAGNYEYSVSRGRTKLAIDDSWHSKVCEEIASK